METSLPQFPPCLHPGLCTLLAPPAVALVETQNCPSDEPGSGRVVQSSCFSGEADTQTSPSATTCGFAPSPWGHAHLTATASTLLFLSPLLLEHSLGHLCSYLSSVLLSSPLPLPPSLECLLHPASGVLCPGTKALLPPGLVLTPTVDLLHQAAETPTPLGLKASVG